LNGIELIQNWIKNPIQIQIQLEKNDMQIGVEDIENLFVNMMLRKKKT
jgi:hypothetical protein